MQSFPLVSRLIAEFVGTFALIAVGVGYLVTQPDGGVVGAALAHGLAIGVMVVAVGHVSGGHFNPAVSFALTLVRKLPPVEMAAYWAAQLAGATAGAFVIKSLYPGEIDAGLPALGKGVSVGAAIGIEAVLTFLLVWVIFGVAVDRDNAYVPAAGPVAGLAIGLVITADIFMGGAMTGAAMNPARALGPEIANGSFTDAVVWWVGPLLGAAVAAIVATAFIRNDSAAGAAAASDRDADQADRIPAA